MKYTISLKIKTYSYVVAEPYDVSAGNKKSAESIAAAMAMDKHGQDNVTEISVISAVEVKANAS